MAKKRKIDNLTPESTASEMEQAILEAEAEKANLPTEPIEKIEAPKEIVEEKKEEKVVEEKIVPKEDIKEAVKEVVEDDTWKKKSYDELRPWITRQSQELAEMRKTVEGLLVNPQKQLEPSVTPEQFQEWMNINPQEASRWLIKQELADQTRIQQEKLAKVENTLGGILAQSSVNRFKSQYEDFDSLKGEVAEELNKLPPEVRDNPLYYDQSLETAYYVVKGKKSKEYAEKLREEGRREAQAKSQIKKEAYVEGSGKVAAEQPFNTKTATSDEIFNYLKAHGAVSN